MTCRKLLWCAAALLALLWAAFVTLGDAIQDWQAWEWAFGKG